MLTARKDEPLKHHEFVMRFANKFKERSEMTRARRSSDIGLQVNSRPSKRPRVSSNQPTLPASRLYNVHAHFLLFPQDGTAKRQVCRYCTHKAQLAKKTGEPKPKISKVRSICNICRSPLCKKCFNEYHTEQYLSKHRCNRVWKG